MLAGLFVATQMAVWIAGSWDLFTTIKSEDFGDLTLFGVLLVKTNLKIRNSETKLIIAVLAVACTAIMTSTNGFSSPITPDDWVRILYLGGGVCLYDNVLAASLIARSEAKSRKRLHIAVHAFNSSYFMAVMILNFPGVELHSTTWVVPLGMFLLLLCNLNGTRPIRFLEEFDLERPVFEHSTFARRLYFAKPFALTALLLFEWSDLARSEGPNFGNGLLLILLGAQLPAYTRKHEANVLSLLRIQLPTIFGAIVLMSGFVVSVWIGQ